MLLSRGSETERKQIQDRRGPAGQPARPPGGGRRGRRAAATGRLPARRPPAAAVRGASQCRQSRGPPPSLTPQTPQTGARCRAPAGGRAGPAGRGVGRMRARDRRGAALLGMRTSLGAGFQVACHACGSLALLPTKASCAPGLRRTRQRPHIFPCPPPPPPRAHAPARGSSPRPPPWPPSSPPAPGPRRSGGGPPSPPPSGRCRGRGAWSAGLRAAGGREGQSRGPGKFGKQARAAPPPPSRDARPSSALCWLSSWLYLAQRLL